MLNDPIVAALLPNDTLNLRLHWQYAAKKCGIQRSRFLWIYEMPSIWSPCVEQPMQQLSLGIETKNDLCTDLRRRRSITVFAFIYYGGANVYCCKTQSITVGSNCESEFIAAYSLCKLIFYVRHILKLSCFNQTEPTPGYIDNLSASKMINDNNTPTEQISQMGI